MPRKVILKAIVKHFDVLGVLKTLAAAGLVFGLAYLSSTSVRDWQRATPVTGTVTSVRETSDRYGFDGYATEFSYDWQGVNQSGRLLLKERRFLHGEEIALRVDPPRVFDGANPDGSPLQASFLVAFGWMIVLFGMTVALFRSAVAAQILSPSPRYRGVTYIAVAIVAALAAHQRAIAEGEALVAGQTQNAHVFDFVKRNNVRYPVLEVSMDGRLQRFVACHGTTSDDLAVDSTVAVIFDPSSVASTIRLAEGTNVVRSIAMALRGFATIIGLMGIFRIVKSR